MVWNIPVACNRASADFMISSTLMTGQYERLVANYAPYRERLAAAPVTEEAGEAELESKPAAGSEDGAITGAARS